MLKANLLAEIEAKENELYKVRVEQGRLKRLISSLMKELQILDIREQDLIIKLSDLNDKMEGVDD